MPPTVLPMGRFRQGSEKVPRRFRDAADRLAGGRGRDDAQPRHEPHEEGGAKRAGGLGPLRRRERHRHRDAVVWRVQHPLAVLGRHRLELAPKVREGGAPPLEEAQPSVGAEVEQRAKEVEDGRDRGAAGIRRPHLGQQLRPVPAVGGGDDRAADGDKEVLVGRLDEAVEAAVAGGAGDGLHAAVALHAVRIVAEVGHALLGAEARNVEKFVDTARGKARCCREHAEHVVCADLRQLRGERVEVCPQLVAVEQVLDWHRRQARRAHRLEARLLVDARPEHMPRVRPQLAQREQRERHRHARRERQRDALGDAGASRATKGVRRERVRQRVD
mmetsp:Transcript_36939/g.119544  ORF Transcript_36939/g.119544 Transcript_36939/m.119544 type:complete len:331 (+) Transcript_36939:398-1390(+)